jgi:hypothetical protein
MLKQAKQASYFICFKTMFHMFHDFVAKLKLVMLHQQVWHVSRFGTHMLHKPHFIIKKLWNNTHWHVAYSCFKQNKCINEMTDAHAYEMQVQMWKPNTWGVTSLPPNKNLISRSRKRTICYRIYDNCLLNNPLIPMLRHAPHDYSKPLCIVSLLGYESIFLEHPEHIQVSPHKRDHIPIWFSLLLLSPWEYRDISSIEKHEILGR